jgi:hypothetical protein
VHRANLYAPSEAAASIRVVALADEAGLKGSAALLASVASVAALHVAQEAPVKNNGSLSLFLPHCARPFDGSADRAFMWNSGVPSQSTLHSSCTAVWCLGKNNMPSSAHFDPAWAQRVTRALLWPLCPDSVAQDLTTDEARWMAVRRVFYRQHVPSFKHPVGSASPMVTNAILSVLGNVTRSFPAFLRQQAAMKTLPLLLVQPPRARRPIASGAINPFGQQMHCGLSFFAQLVALGLLLSERLSARGTPSKVAALICRYRGEVAERDKPVAQRVVAIRKCYKALAGVVAQVTNLMPCSDTDFAHLITQQSSSGIWVQLPSGEDADPFLVTELLCTAVSLHRLSPNPLAANSLLRKNAEADLMGVYEQVLKKTNVWRNATFPLRSRTHLESECFFVESERALLQDVVEQAFYFYRACDRVAELCFVMMGELTETRTLSRLARTSMRRVDAPLLEVEVTSDVKALGGPGINRGLYKTHTTSVQEVHHSRATSVEQLVADTEARVWASQGPVEENQSKLSLSRAVAGSELTTSLALLRDAPSLKYIMLLPYESNEHVWLLRVLGLCGALHELLLLRGSLHLALTSQHTAKRSVAAQPQKTAAAGGEPGGSTDGAPGGSSDGAPGGSSDGAA